GGNPLISAVGMLVTTNDAFFGLDSVDVIGGRWWIRTAAPAYDAGSEADTESCSDIPGPPCMNPGVRVTEGAEGYVHVHQGIDGTGDLDPAIWDWHNPVVSIQIIRGR
ncbi:MAG: spondin domain-containing protein, partial [Thermoanaerobaculia bacterium]|nr:spondin domain-containing protein [Thermoanaerobaculia bacterium]